MIQIKNDRRKWCEKMARKYFASKNRDKWYHTYYTDPDCDADFNCFELLPDSFVKDLKEAFDDFVSENKLGSVKDIEPDWRAEIIKQMEPERYGVNVDPWDGNYILVDVDFDDYRYFCQVRGTKKETLPDRIVPNGVSYIKVDDEDYIEALTELLYAGTEISFDDLYGIIPQTCELIKVSCERNNIIGDIVLEEMNNDVKAILNQCGGKDKIPTA